MVELSHGINAISSKWVFKQKSDTDGRINRYKARLVVKGFTQKCGLDYNEIFSPVVRFESARTNIALAAKHGLNLHQMGVATAILQDELKEDIYI